MKLLRIFTITFVFAMFSSSLLKAENISSTNYTLIDPEIASTSGLTASSNYQALLLSGSGIEYTQISSSLYKIGSGQAYTFMANVPTIDCFETTTNSGNTSCTGLPANNGMEGECGEGGCYDRAMIQINEEGNPTDTLYLIEVTKNNWLTTYIVDGTSHALKSNSSKSILDYKTKSSWENSPWNSTNIIGLTPGVQYTVRAKALHGDFTESPAGPTKSATTAYPTATFDLDIGTQFSDENDAPYSISLGALSPNTATFSTEYIKVDFSTNAWNGAEVYIKDAYSGLRSSSSLYLLDSTTEDLANPSAGDGYGIKYFDRTQRLGSLGYAVVDSAYVLSGSNIGAITSASNTRIMCSLDTVSDACSTGTPTWILDGSGLFVLGARASLDAPALADYEDTLTFTITGSW